MSSLCNQNTNLISLKKGKNILQTNSLVTNKKNNTDQTHDKGGVACPLFYGKGSLTVEAAMVLPLMLSFLLLLLSLVEVMRTAVEQRISQQELIRSSAVAASVILGENKSKNGDCLVVDRVYPIALSFSAFGYENVRVRHTSVVHIFNGYDVSQVVGTKEQDAYVYITKSGSVYHLSRSCRVLCVDISQMKVNEIATARNTEGKKYYKCQVCRFGFNSDDTQEQTVFYTPYGVKYHASLACPEIQRMIQVVKRSEVGERKACKFCGF